MVGEGERDNDNDKDYVYLPIGRKNQEAEGGRVDGGGWVVRG